MLHEIFFAWMANEQRTPGFLAEQSGVDLDRLIALERGEDAPTIDELVALSGVTGVPVEELREAADATSSATEAGQQEWYSVREAAEHLGVSTDTVYAMINAGTLDHTVVGRRLKKIHREDLGRLRMGQTRDERVRRSERSSRRTVSDEPEAPPPRLF